MNERIDNDQDFIGPVPRTDMEEPAELPTVPHFFGRITFRNTETGDHRTFRVRRQASDSEFAAGKTIVALLTGSDNESSYTQFGFASEDGTVHVWRKKRTPAHLWFAEMVSAFLGGRTSEEVLLPGGADIGDGTEEWLRFPARGREYSIHKERACAICGRALTTPESVSRGIGPVCVAKF